MTDIPHLKPLIHAMPGLIALKCRSAGEIGILALLGIGTVHSGGTPFEDRAIAAFYADLVTDRDPARTVRECWEYAAAVHPWMTTALSPIAEYLADPNEAVVEGLRTAAEWLATISISGCEHMAHADLLGRVLTEHRAQVRKTERPGHSFTLAEGMLEAAFTGKVPLENTSFADLWAASGMRAIALAVIMRDHDEDPTTVRWVLLEADPMYRVCLAINALAWEIGEQVEIYDGTAHKQAMISAYMEGQIPDFQGLFQGKIAAVPEEVLAGVHDTPPAAKKRGKKRRG